MALTKSVAALDEWQAVAASAVVEGATADVSGNYQTVLHIFAAIVTAATVSNGADIRVQISANTTGDEDWFDFVNFIGPTAAASASNTEPISNAGGIAGGATTCTVASTTGYALPSAATDNGLRYIKDSTIANSEVIFQTALTANTNISWLDGTANAHAQNIPLWNIVGAYTCQLPDSAVRARIVYNNCKDTTAQIDVMARITRITAIS
jgi:hypothetical protein